MDQEKFDRHLMDYLFDELDEVTRAAMKRKLEADAHCAKVESELRATIEVGQLPIEEPSADLEERILATVEVAQRGEPLYGRIARFLSYAGSLAMRRELAMAAVLVLVLGSAILLLRTPPGSVAVTPSRDELPVPGAAESPTLLPPTDELSSAEPLAAEPTAQASAAAPQEVALADEPQRDAEQAEKDKKELAALDQQYDRGLKNYNQGKFQEAQRDFAAYNRVGGPKAPSSALYEARAVRSYSGCKEAVPYYRAVRERYPASAVAADAMWEEADCHVQLGQTGEARQLWLALRDNQDYKERANKELSSRSDASGSGKGGVAAPRRARPAAQPSPQAAPPSASEPAPGGAGRSKTAAPDEYSESL